jgi:uncharacterized protein (DUF1778 family)
MSTPARRTKSENLTLRISPLDKELLEEAAIRSGSDITAFVLAPALDRARKIAAKEDVTVLTGPARERFIALVEKAPAPSKRFLRNLSDERHEIVE